MAPLHVTTKEGYEIIGSLPTSVPRMRPWLHFMWPRALVQLCFSLHCLILASQYRWDNITPIPSSISCNQLQFHIIINSQLVEQYLRGVTIQSSRTVSQSIEFVKEEVSLQLQGSISSADWKLESLVHPVVR